MPSSSLFTVPTSSIRFPFSSTTNRSRFVSLVRAKAGNDYYSTLNLSNNASLQEIKTSYRKLARKVWFLLSFFKMGYAIFCLFWFVSVVIFMGRVWFLGNWNLCCEVIEFMWNLSLYLSFFNN
jgi:hypothetical protein